MTTALNISESLLPGTRAAIDLADFDDQVRSARERFYTRVERVPLRGLDHWHEDPTTGWLRHTSKRFFSIEGLRLNRPDGPVPRWCQPIINQPETGVLGILVKEIAGTPHLLMQLKAEPGNRGGLQLSPTVQATRSNYTGVHGGKSVPYLEYFRSAPPHQVLADVRQSEQGAWFLRKRNRNIIVSTTEDVPLHDGFVWLSVGQVLRLMRRDDLVNMDTRTVLSALPLAGKVLQVRHPVQGDAFTGALLRSLNPAGTSCHLNREILSWLTAVRSHTELGVEPAPIHGLDGWRRNTESIYHESGGFFEVIGVRVESSGREVAHWAQPMVTTAGIGLIAFVVTRIAGVLHVLVHARVEPGLMDVAELAPTVQCNPNDLDHLPPAARPAFLDVVLNATPLEIRFDTVLSDEGGRFFRVANRHLIVETATVFDHPDYRWMTVRQLIDLLRHPYYVNLQARSLVVCLLSLLAEGAPGALKTSKGADTHDGTAVSAWQ